MSWIKELLTDIPLSEVLKERIALADDRVTRADAEYRRIERELSDATSKIERLEKEVYALRAQVSAASKPDLSSETIAVFKHLFHAEGEECDITFTSHRVGLSLGKTKYHLDALKTAKFAACTGGNFLHGHTYWSLTPRGRKFAVESGYC